jgi:homoserine kinase type II
VLAAPDATTLAAVLARFPLDAPAIEREFDASTRNDNYLVRDAAGKPYVLRRYRRNLDAVRVEFQLRFQQFLLDHDFPTPAIIPTHEDALGVFDFDAPGVLFAYVEGGHFDFDRPVQAVEAGRRLAEFHLLTEGFGESPPQHELQLVTRSYWTDGERELGLLAQRFGASNVEGEIEYLRAWLQDLRRALPLSEYDALPAGWLHNDYHGRNLIYRHDRIVALLDFDVIERGPYILDLERGLHSFGREHRGSHVVRPEWGRWFLEGYESLRPLTLEECAALPALYGIHLSGAFDAIYGMIERDGEDPLAEFRQDVENLRLRREQAETIARLFST